MHILLLSLWWGGALSVWILGWSLPRYIESPNLVFSAVNSLRILLENYCLVAGPGLLLTLTAGWLSLQAPLRNRAILIVVMTILAGGSGRFLTPVLQRMVLAMGRPLADMNLESPAYIEFVQLKSLSQGLLLAHGLGAFLLIVMAIRVGRPKRRFGIEL